MLHISFRMFFFLFPRLIFFFFFFFSLSSFSNGKKKKEFDHIKPCLSSLCIPWGASTAESPRDNKGKDIKAHKQHTHKDKGEEVCVLADLCLRKFTLLHVYADGPRLCVCAALNSELDFRAFTCCSSVPHASLIVPPSVCLSTLSHTSFIHPLRSVVKDCYTRSHVWV